MVWFTKRTGLTFSSTQTTVKIPLTSPAWWVKDFPTPVLFLTKTAQLSVSILVPPIDYRLPFGCIWTPNLFTLRLNIDVFFFFQSSVEWARLMVTWYRLDGNPHTCDRACAVCWIIFSHIASLMLLALSNISFSLPTSASNRFALISGSSVWSFVEGEFSRGGQNTAWSSRGL